VKDDLQGLYDEERKKRKKAELDLLSIKDQIDSLKKGKGNMAEVNDLLSSKIEENKKLKEKNSLLEDQMQSIKFDAAKGANYERDMEILKRDKLKLLDEIGVMKDIMKSNESDNKLLKEINANLSKENTKLQEQKSGDSRKLRDILKEYEVKIEREIEEKHAIVNDKAKEISKLLDAINDLEQKVAEKDEIAQRLEGENEANTKKYNESLKL